MLKRIVLKFGIALILNIIGVGLLCWFAGWRRVEYFSNALVLLGMGYCLIGLITVMGNYSGRGEGNYQLARTVSDANISERARQDLDSVLGSYSALFFMVSTGVVTLFFSWLVLQEFVALWISKIFGV